MKRPCSWHEGQDGSISISTDLAARTFRKELQLTHRTHIFDAVAEPQDCASVHPGLRFPVLALFGAAAMTGAEHWQARLVLYPGLILPANHATRTSARPNGIRESCSGQEQPEARICAPLICILACETNSDVKIIPWRETSVEHMRSGSMRPKRRNIVMKARFALPVLVLACPILAGQDTVRNAQEEIHKLHQDSKAYIAFLEDPERDAYQKPQEVIKELDLKEGEVIADIGAGSGYFTFRLAHVVGERGRVYAVDISPDMIRYMNRRIRDLNLKNVITVLAEPDDPLLQDNSVDLFFVCDTWHHIGRQTEYLALMKRMLKPGGQVAMIDFQKRDLPFGPPLEMKISRGDLVRQMESNGFRLKNEYTFLPYQYFMVFAMK